MTDEQKQKMSEVYVQDFRANQSITDDELYLIKDAYSAGLNARDEEVKVLREALEKIRKPHYGLDITDLDDHEYRADYWAGRAIGMMNIARGALEHTSKKEVSE